jgi:uncharacterized protein YkwD
LFLANVPAVLLSIGFAAQADDSSGEGTIDSSALENEVFRRVNAHRRKSGRALLVYDEEVAAIARGHSQAMARGRSRFGHGRFDARVAEVAKRVELAGMAENVSKHRRSADFAETAVAEWLASPIHRANIDGDYSLTGVGAARGKDGIVYFTQLFVRVR